MSLALHGLAVSSGIAIGRVRLLSHSTLEVSHYTVTPRQVAREVERFERALAAVRGELDELLGRGGDEGPSELATFVELHGMILVDPEICEVTKDIIRQRRCNAEWALVQQMAVLLAQFDGIDDLYLRERRSDVVQVVERIVKELLGQSKQHAQRLNKMAGEEGVIIVAHDLAPADVIQLKDARIAAFITDVGGATSHTAIVARSLGIPAVVALRHAREVACEGEMLVVDGARGVVLFRPDERILEEYQLRKTELELGRNKLKRLAQAQSVTLDGVEIELLANIELPDDVDRALENGAAGVGLFRTEFLYLNRGDMPNEEEQFEAYRTVLKAMGKKRPVTIRTFDLGGDKDLHTMTEAERNQPNPALGLRAIRMCLAEPQMFVTQLRALLRASVHGRLRILVPMLAHVHEIDQTLAYFERAKQSLRDEKIKFDERVEVGGMIEIPAAAIALHLFLRKLDFLSIGTNDLIQYTLAIDRTDDAVSHLYDPLHPAVLFLMANTIQMGEKAGVPVSVCGELAGDVELTRLLLGLGLRQFSMHPSRLLEVKQQVLRSSVAEVEPGVRKLLRQEDPVKIRDQLDKLNT